MAAGNLGKVLLAQGKLAEAEPLLVEAVAWDRKEWGNGGIFNAPLVELRREHGRLDEAEEHLVRGERVLRATEQRVTLGLCLAERALVALGRGDLQLR